MAKKNTTKTTAAETTTTTEDTNMTNTTTETTVAAETVVAETVATETAVVATEDTNMVDTTTVAVADVTAADAPKPRKARKAKAEPKAKAEVVKAVAFPKKKASKKSKKSVVELVEPAGSPVISPVLVKAIAPILKEELCDGKGKAKLNANGKPVTISGKEVAKRLLGKFAVTNEQMLYLLVNVAIQTGEVAGFSSRKGRDGGIFRLAE